MVQLLRLPCDKLLGVVRKRQGARELEPILFLFFGTVFFRAIVEDGLKNLTWRTEFLERESHEKTVK